MTADLPSSRERAALVGLVTGRVHRDDADRSLDELTGLVAAAGGQAVVRVLQERGKPDPGTFLGRGKLDELAVACDECRVDLAVFDHELTPAQVGHIERVVGCRVVDRTQVILDIFARRAHTREGKWQVELAQLRYLLPRLAGSGTALSRLGGGIGTRGPGETKLETDRRRIRQRIAKVSASIDEVRQRRSRLRDRRRRGDAATVVLVGYTNAGKTTLFNLLTRADAHASDALFVTLDPLVRRVALPDDRELLVSDTVGFIDRLPHALVAAFRATLEEVADADLLIHVIDAAAPDRDRRIEAVLEVLGEVDAALVPRLDVFNKADKLDEDGRLRLVDRHPQGVVMSALTGDGRAALVERVVELLNIETRRVSYWFDVSQEAGRLALARVYRHGRVIDQVNRGHRIRIDADVPRRLAGQLGQSAGPAGGEIDPRTEIGHEA